MATSTVEDYVKRIYLQQQVVGQGHLVSFGALAASMHVVPGTVTTMVKALADSGLVFYEPRQGVRLTPTGEKLALHVLRRHRLLELFLVKVLHFDWSEVHVEAEELEHSVSDRLLDRIDDLLGKPSYDPHGDPIPSADGEVLTPEVQKLSSSDAAVRGTIARIADQDSQFLRYVTDRGLTPGASVTIDSVDTAGDAVTVSVNGTRVTMGRNAAAKILIALNQ